MKNALPPLQGLYSFYIAAEMGSFKQAAEHLYVTPAAMSQQIRQLEERLEVTLFIRQHRKVVLTEEGHLLHRYAKQGFNALQDGVRHVSTDPDPKSLSLSVLPSFAQHWLVPRLGGFTEAQSELSVFMMTKNDLVDFQQDRVDMCVRFGKGQYPGLHSELLMADHLYPVCHPLYLEKHNIQSLEDLNTANLIEDARPDMSWEYWFELAGLTEIYSQPSIRYKGAHVVLEGALAVQGVALARHSLAWKFIQQGLLTKIGNVEVRSGFSYHLVAPQPYFKREKNKQFCHWIHSEANSFWQSSQNELGDDRLIIQAK